VRATLADLDRPVVAVEDVQGGDLRRGHEQQQVRKWPRVVHVVVLHAEQGKE